MVTGFVQIPLAKIT